MADGLKFECEFYLMGFRKTVNLSLQFYFVLFALLTRGVFLYAPHFSLRPRFPLLPFTPVFSLSLSPADAAVPYQYHS